MSFLTALKVKIVGIFFEKKIPVIILFIIDNI
jgi:hypothetical protein